MRTSGQNDGQLLAFPGSCHFPPILTSTLWKGYYWSRALSISIPRLQNTSGDTIFHTGLLSALLCWLILVCFWSNVCPYMVWNKLLTMKYWFVEQKAMSLTSRGIWLMTLPLSSIAKTYCYHCKINCNILYMHPNTDLLWRTFSFTEKPLIKFGKVSK